MKRFLLAALFVVFPVTVLAAPESCILFLKNIFQDEAGKFVSLKDGRQLYTQFTPPKKNKPIYVLVNGLVYSSERWNKVADALVKKGNGVLRYEFMNQGKTLAWQEKAVFHSTEKQAQDLLELIQMHKVGNEEVHLVGLSYGSSIATEFAKRYPDQIKTLTLASPLVVSSEKYSSVGQVARNSLQMYKFWGNQMYESMYENTYRNFFRNNIKSSPHSAIELKKYQDALFELGKSVRDYDLKEEIKLIKNVRIKMITAGKEEAPAKADMMKVIEYLKAKGDVKVEEIADGFHALPDSNPAEMTQFLLEK